MGLVYPARSGAAGREQRPLRLRAPKPGEKAVVVGITTDQPEGEDPAVFFFNGVRVATGERYSHL
ncbi:MAG: hypothetical protein H7145_22950 [Akkermansiaceae bacterium]|nr:hypothetical protein [Armatimonadota bacterium]